MIKILRPQLNSLLTTDARVTLVSAPSGYGKSSLVSESLKELEQKIWIDITPDFSDIFELAQLICKLTQNSLPDYSNSLDQFIIQSEQH